MPGWLNNWLERHRHPASRMLHAVGIPITVCAIVLAAIQLAQSRWDVWWRPAALFAAGYLLQWIGHVIEGNDMGEIIVVKRWLGKPYQAVAPRYLRKDDESR